MLKDTTYREKFATLKDWVPVLLDSVKKDIKNEHLKKDWSFVKQYFASKNINKLSIEELSEAYSHALANSENAEEIGEFLSNRWLMKNTEIYHFFETELTKISPKFSEIEQLDHEVSVKMMNNAVAQFGAPKTYLFCVLNSVVFPRGVFEELDRRAQESKKMEDEQQFIALEKASFEDLKVSYEQQIARLKDKYEKKILGLEKKYHQDIESYKKQIASFQRKLNPS